MKRLYSAIALCAALLVFEAVVFLPASSAKQDVVAALLELPAPPPPNPLVKKSARSRPPEFYSKSHPPPDNASMEDLLEYWSHQSKDLRRINYVPDMTDATFDRIKAEIERDPSLLQKYLGALPENSKAAEMVKAIYDREGTTGSVDKETRAGLKQWLTYHSPYFSSELYKTAQQAGDTETYVTNHDELLALARVDYDRARPLIDRLYANGTTKATRVLATWAYYRHALDTDSTGDIDRYRGELKAFVEDKGLPGPMRDLAMDALVTEKEWPGRDEWYMGLLADPTLTVIEGYTGLTTLITSSPEEKYLDKMLEMLKNGDPVVRSAVIRNLSMQINSGRPELIKALLPWLEDPKWAKDVADSRGTLVRFLRNISMPESVPGLIKMLDEKVKRPNYAAIANMAANAPAANTPRLPAVNARPANAAPQNEIEVFQFRSDAVAALAKQADPSAVPPLRRVLSEVQGYERNTVVEALLRCNGFSVPEQLDAVESAAKNERNVPDANSMVNQASAMANMASAVTNMPMNPSTYEPSNNGNYYKTGPLTPAEQKALLGYILLQSREVSDGLAAAVVARIEVLDDSDTRTAARLRQVLMHWQNAAVNVMMLHDVKRDKADVGTVVRLLATRKLLREQQSAELTDLRASGSSAAGIASCLIEDAGDYSAILDGENAETKIALLACGRMIRAKLDVQKAAELLKSGDKRLATAAERYLESEDSSAARAFVLSRHPNEARITGATTAFSVDGSYGNTSEYLQPLFVSVAEADDSVPGTVYYDPGEIEKTEKRLQKEVLADAELFGVYAYDKNYVRIYKDRAIVSWDEDDSRYRERQLTQYEFDSLKAYLNDNQVNDLAPFLMCDGDYCNQSKELLMLGKSGGRRIFFQGETPHAFFAGLDKYFADLKQGPSSVKYALSKDLPGLELLLANDDLHSETVWKEGDDLRVAVTDKTVRKKVEEEIDSAVDATNASPENGDAPPETEPDVRAAALREKLTAKREFEGYSWHKIVGGNDGGFAPQPPGIEVIPAADGLPVRPTQEQWKARAGDVEIRADKDGLYKVSHGKITKIHEGSYDSPVITPNGKWVVVYRIKEEDPPQVVRFNMLTGKESNIQIEGYQSYIPVAYLPTLNKVLLLERYESEGEGEVPNKDPDDLVPSDREPTAMILLDPETGTLQPIAGEFRPLTQQRFRPLQSTGKPNEFWAAIPDREKNETVVGIYDTKVFGFKQVLRVPKISFNSMSMWMDAPSNCLYFVYRGHLLKLPMKK